MSGADLTSAMRQSALPVLAIVVPCFNEQAALPNTFDALLEVLNRMVGKAEIASDSFLYFVDDGSADLTWPLIAAAHERNKSVRGLKLARNFGHQNALLAGLMGVMDRCDAAISIDADLQQDPLVIPDFLAQFRDGIDVVLGVRNDRGSDGWFKRRSAEMFYLLMRTMGVPLIANHADYRLLSRRAMKSLSLYGESNLFLRATCAQLGFKTSVVCFDVKERAYGSSHYSFDRMLKLALTGIVSNSVVPLRAVALIGFAIFTFSALMASYVLYRTLAVGDTVPGWASTTLPIYFIGGVQLLCLGVIGEYVGQVVSEVKRRPRYLNDTELF